MQHDPSPTVALVDLLDQIASRIDVARRILVFSHVAPDGDAVGSALALMWILRALDKEVEVSFEDAMPPFLAFLPGANEVSDRPLAGHDLIIAVDGSDATRYGANFTRAYNAAECPPIIGIDHHKTNTRFADTNWVDSSDAATAQMILVLARHAWWPMPRAAAICLATGCVTDTNGFTTDHTTATVLEDVAALMRQGAPLAKIIRQTMSSRTRADVALWGRILSTLEVEDSVAWALNRAADRAAVGAGEEEGGGIATFLRNIEGVNIGLLFMEVAPQTVRLSARAEVGYDVSDLMLALGGGGHAQAAGATLEMSLDEAVALVVPQARAITRALKSPVLM